MIREACLQDFDAVSALEAQVFALHIEARPDMFKPRREPLDRAYFESLIAGDDTKIFVFEEGGALLGHCITQKAEVKDHPALFDAEVLIIDDLCVDESAQGRQIGQRLFEKAKEYAKEIGAQRLELSVWSFNESARRFYERLGMSTRISRMEMPID